MEAAVSLAVSVLHQTTVWCLRDGGSYICVLRGLTTNSHSHCRLHDGVSPVHTYDCISGPLTSACIQVIVFRVWLDPVRLGFI